MSASALSAQALLATLLFASCCCRCYRRTSPRIGCRAQVISPHLDIDSSHLGIDSPHLGEVPRVSGRAVLICAGLLRQKHLLICRAQVTLGRAALAF